MLPFLRAATCVVFALFASNAQAVKCPDWTPAKTRSEITELQGQIAQWDDSYHRQGVALIKDELYDQSRQRLDFLRTCPVL